MPKIRVNLDDVESGFALYPDDSYLVEIQPTTKTKKSEEGGAYIFWIAKIIEGEFDGKLISWNTSLKENALWNLKNLLECIGLAWDEDGFELEDAFGKQLIVTNQQRDYQDEPRNNVVKYAAVA